MLIFLLSPMRKICCFVVITLFCIVLQPARAAAIPNDTVPLAKDTLLFDLKLPIESIPSLQHGMDEQKRQKLISAMLAFPFPFGFMGAHRVMLGCKPWIPVVYVVTFGGCFGILPLIDFCAILATKDITQYENNPHVFMWLKWQTHWFHFLIVYSCFIRCKWK